MREGFDPRDVQPASLKESAVVDEDEAEEGGLPEGLDDSRHWNGEDHSEGESSKAHGRPRYGSLGDGNVWDGHGESSR